MIYFINGSPRTNGNTAVLLDKAMEGAKAAGVETERIDLYKLDYKGCASCFACKLKGGGSKGRCVQKDGLSPLLEALRDAGAVVIGSPVYFFNIPGATQSFLERFFYPYGLYTEETTCFPRRIPSAFIYTMNMKEDAAHEAGVIANLRPGQIFAARLLGEESEALFSFDTKQFDDYGRYEASKFSEKEKIEHRRLQFPLDCRAAFEMGKRIAERSGVK